MNIQHAGFKVHRLAYLILILFFLALSFASQALLAASEEGKWSGVDETVVGKFAKEQGREAGEPLINTGKGDLLLFVFLLAGTIGGFAAGYYWRALIVERYLKVNGTGR